MCFRDVRAERQSPFRCRQSVFCPAMPKPQFRLRQRHQRPGAGIGWIEPYGLRANPDDHFGAAGVAIAATDPMLPRHQGQGVDLSLLSVAGLSCPINRAEETVKTSEL